MHGEVEGPSLEEATFLSRTQFPPLVKEGLALWIPGLLSCSGVPAQVHSALGLPCGHGQHQLRVAIMSLARKYTPGLVLSKSIYSSQHLI